MHLVIVESPTKAKTIGRFLGKEYEIQASMGHVIDLPKSKLGIDVDHNFEPLYELIKDKKQVVSDLKTAASHADSIILATDPDREGEAIAFHVADILKKSLKGKTHGEFKRIVFHEITSSAIEEAIKNPRTVDTHLVDSQTARRVLDRLVGYKLSPLLWQKIRRGLSAGRVQSVALRLIVEREKEIEKFKKEQYFTILAKLKKSGYRDAIDFELIEINNGKIETQEAHDLYDGQYRVSKTMITTKDQATEIVADLVHKEFVVIDVVKKETFRSPGPPFTTSTLQQEASRRFGYSGKRTMSLAQKLYEEGFITYHRTDSVTLSNSAVTAIRNYTEKEFGNKYIPEKPRFYITKQKLAQEAHEAIRPTHINRLRGEIKDELGEDFAKLYELIWKRALACQMADAVIEATAVTVDAKGSKDAYRFKANGSILVFDGFLKINPQALEDRKLPDFVAGEKLEEVEIKEEEHETTPPPRYNDASLIKTLEEKGIGRPSTYATIISTIEQRRYVERVERRFIPTPIGIAVNDFLVANFSEIDDIPFTAQMEDELDTIASGKGDWHPMIKKFYTHLESRLGSVKDVARVKIEVEETDQLCPKCKRGNLVIRMGKFGKFFSCSTFPDCDFTKQYVEETPFECPQCKTDGRKDGKVIVKKTRKGRRFYGCSNYPACKFAAWKLEDIKKQLS